MKAKNETTECSRGLASTDNIRRLALRVYQTLRMKSRAIHNFKSFGDLDSAIGPVSIALGAVDCISTAGTRKYRWSDHSPMRGNGGVYYSLDTLRDWTLVDEPGIKAAELVADERLCKSKEKAGMQA